MNKQGFQALVKKVRRQPGVSQKELALELGVSFATTNCWENGRIMQFNLARRQFEGLSSKRVLTLKKIPKTLLKKCELGHDDYCLEIWNLLQTPPEPEEPMKDSAKMPNRRFSKGNLLQASLFDLGGDQ